MVSLLLREIFDRMAHSARAGTMRMPYRLELESQK